MKRALLAGLSLLVALGCNELVSVGGENDLQATTVGVSVTTSGTILHASRVDLLLAIDNSPSMGDKQALLGLALEDLVEALVNPPCVNAFGALAATQPGSGFEACASGYQRQRAPIQDLHVAVVDSSLGGHGSDSCPSTRATNDDAGHLVDRLSPASTTPTGTSYEGEHFLAWDPAQALNPPGQEDEPTFVADFRQLVSGVGEVGCSYPSQLESWYRFLADPNPYLELKLANGEVSGEMTDTGLLQERADFLRPDSLLVVMVLSDRDDCSTKESGDAWRSNQLSDPSDSGAPFLLPPARSICATAPNDPCCVSCAQATPTGCTDDPSCTTTLDALHDRSSVRCFDQKRRFGVDFLYPLDRYATALGSASIADRDGDVMNNPIFSNLDPQMYPGAETRATSLVLFEAIVGVPWEDLATNPSDLTKGFRIGADLDPRWNVVLGDPPGDPLMKASIDPRTGTNPITGDKLAAPGSSFTNAINGHERDLPDRDDLQYACIFPLAEPRDCSLAVNADACDCVVVDAGDNAGDPLCATNPADANRYSLQIAGKAYPGTRELGLVEGLGGNGIAASICPAQSTHADALDYGYRPAMAALVSALAGRVVVGQ